MTTYEFPYAMQRLRDAINFAEDERNFIEARRWANEVEASYNEDTRVLPYNKIQLIAVRDYWLGRGHKGTAAAIDNAIDLIEKSIKQREIDAQLDRMIGEFTDVSELAPVMTFGNGEVTEVGKQIGSDKIPF